MKPCFRFVRNAETRSDRKHSDSRAKMTSRHTGVRNFSS